ncbi:WD40 repeat-like protein [Pholiota molesta]|nr:WD40 repeat-like protein [Pholiota molesta]
MEKANSNMLFANFNQDFSCISVGTRKGYSVTNCDPFGRMTGRGACEMLFCTSLIVLVGAADQPQSSPRKLQIVNTKVPPIHDMRTPIPSSILAVKLNRKSLVIVLEMEIYIYDISNMRLLHVIETTPNPEGPSALSICALPPPRTAPISHIPHPCPRPPPRSRAPLGGRRPRSRLPSAAPASQNQSGDVLLFSTRSLTVANVIQAHKAPLSFLSINSTGTLLATSSEKGTVIRVWSIPGAEKLYHSSKSSASSVMDGPASPPESAFIEKKKGNSVSSSLRRKYLPNTLTEMWEPSRDFAFLRLPSSGARSIVALSGTMPHVMVLSSEGYFYLYSIDLEKGGECSLMKQYNLLDSGDESTGLAD